MSNLREILVKFFDDGEYDNGEEDFGTVEGPAVSDVASESPESPGFSAGSEAPAPKPVKPAEPATMSGHEGESGLQKHSIGSEYPFLVVVKGNGPNQVIFARSPDGTEMNRYSTAELGFRGAHRLAERDAQQAKAQSNYAADDTGDIETIYENDEPTTQPAEPGEPAAEPETPRLISREESLETPWEHPWPEEPQGPEDDPFPEEPQWPEEKQSMPLESPVGAEAGVQSAPLHEPPAPAGSQEAEIGQLMQVAMSEAGLPPDSAGVVQMASGVLQRTAGMDQSDSIIEAARQLATHQESITQSRRRLGPELSEKVARSAPGTGGEISLSVPEVEQLLDVGVVGFISAGRAPDETISDDEVQARHVQLGKDLSAGGLRYMPAHGKYEEEEDTYLVMSPEISRLELEDLGNKYNQEAVLYSKGGENEFIFTKGELAGQAHPGKGWQLREGADDFYTEFPTPSGKMFKFQLTFDFDTMRRAELKARRGEYAKKNDKPGQPTPQEPSATSPAPTEPSADPGGGSVMESIGAFMEGPASAAMQVAEQQPQPLEVQQPQPAAEAQPQEPTAAEQLAKPVVEKAGISLERMRAVPSEEPVYVPNRGNVSIRSHLGYLERVPQEMVDNHDGIEAILSDPDYRGRGMEAINADLKEAEEKGDRDAADVLIEERKTRQELIDRRKSQAVMSKTYLGIKGTGDNEGLTLWDVAKHFDQTTADKLGGPMEWKFNAGIGIKRDLSGEENRQRQAEVKGRIWELYDQGAKPKQIARLVGKEFGLTPAQKTPQSIEEVIEEREQMRTVGEAMADEAEYALQQDDTGIGWYGREVEETRQILTEVHPEFENDSYWSHFLLFNAITSNGNEVIANGRQAEKLYSEWKDGNWLLNEEFGGVNRRTINAGLARMRKMQEYFESRPQFAHLEGQARTEAALAKMHKFLQSSFDARDLDRSGWMTAWDPETLQPVPKRHAKGPKKGEIVINPKTGRPEYRSSSTDELAHVQLRGAMLFGPKIGSFYANLNGDFSTLTMDRWFTRTGSRLRGDVSQGGVKNTLKDSARDLRVAVSKLTPDKMLGFNKPGQKRQIMKELTALARTGEADVNGLAMQFARKQNGVYQATDFTDKSALNVSAKKVHENAFGTYDAPKTREREWLRGTLEHAKQSLASRGYELSNADLQALLWYHEKRLYSNMGVGSDRAAPASYSDAARVIREDAKRERRIPA